MDRQTLEKLKMPDSPGVYTFRDSKLRPLYIGRATSLRDRVKSYMKDDLIATRGPRLVDMVMKASSVTWQETDSVLEAVLLETALIKRYQPPYNVDERDDKSSQYVVITQETWPRVFLMRARDLEHGISSKTLPFKIRARFGPFVEIGVIREAMKILRKIFPFRDKKATDPRHERFYQMLGQSPEGTEEALASYRRTIRYLTLFFAGESKRLKSLIGRSMRQNIRQMAFEKAELDKRLIYALEHVNDIALLKKEKASGQKSFRIEAYDIAHLGGSDVVGSMTVVTQSGAATDEYRRFKIKQDKNDDNAALKEMLSRRLNHPEWPYPDLIVVDGNEVQANTASDVLKARRISIPIAAVTKNDKHKAEKIIGLDELVKAYKDQILLANAEAHRFAISYHRLRRGKRLTL